MSCVESVRGAAPYARHLGGGALKGLDRGRYELVFRMDGINADCRMPMSLLSDPVHMAVH